MTMTSYQSLFIALLIVNTVVASGLTWFVWRRRSAPGSMSLCVITAAVAAWSLLYVCELTAPALADKVLWAKLQYVSIVLLPVALVTFAADYGSFWQNTRTRLVALSIVPGITFACVITNEWHGLIWQSVSIQDRTVVSALAVAYGTWFWIHVAYSYLLLLSGTLMIMYSAVYQIAVYRWQAVAVILAVLAPWMGNVVYLYGTVQFDITPFSFAITGVLFSISLFGFHLLDLVPVGRTAVLEHMSDGVLVLDRQCRVSDCNPSAARMLHQTIETTLGKPIQAILPDYRLDATGSVDEQSNYQQIRTAVADEERMIEIRTSSLHDRRKMHIGYLLVLRDVTESRRAAEERQKLTALVEYSSDFIGMARLDGQILFINRYGCQLVGLADIDDARTRTMFDFIPDAEKIRFQHHIIPDVLTHGTWEGELLFNHFGNEPAVPMQSSVFLVRDAVNGQPLAIATVSRDITERKRSERALRESEERFRRLADAAFEGIAIHRRDIILDANKALETMFGYGDGELAGKMTSELITASSLARLSELVQANPDATYEATGIDRQGNQIIIEVSGRMTTYAGVPARVTAVRDVTEQKRREQQVRKQAQQISLLNDITRASIETLDLHQMLHILADRMSELIDADTCAITLWDEAQQFPAVVGGRGRHQPDSVWLRLTRHTPTREQNRSGSLSVVHELGGTLITLPLLRGEQHIGSVVLAYNVSRAIPPDDMAICEHAARQIALAIANVQLYQSVAEQRRRLQLVVDASSDGIALISRDQQVLVVNSAALQYLGLPGQPAHWIDRTLEDAMGVITRQHRNVATIGYREIQRIEAGDLAPLSGDYELDSMVIAWESLPIQPGTHMAGRMMILRNVTEQRLLERMRNDLTHTLVHDLRNPLTAIQGAISAIQFLDRNDPSIDEILDVAAYSSRRMQNLINAILDVSRLENGSMPIEYRAFSLEELVRETFQVLSPLSSAKQISLHFTCPPDAPVIWADAGLVSRVFQNLIGNAITFTPEQGEVCVLVHPITTTSEAVTISITDTGSGVPAEIQGRLFQKFTTGKNSQQGSGLGLAFCRLAIEAHGGAIWLERASGTGATFSFTLPTIEVAHSTLT